MPDERNKHDGGSRNEGEGNKTREYNAGQRSFVESGNVNEKARETEKSLDTEKHELERAEAVGKRHSHDDDPALKRK
jgi:hypothetical protein